MVVKSAPLPFSNIVSAGGGTPIFAARDHVRIAVRFPIGHFRVPNYIRGKPGVVEKVIEPPDVNNEEEGFGRRLQNGWAVIGLFWGANLMLRKFSLAIVVAVCLSLPAIAFAASAHVKRHVVHRWHGYGFLPGYHQPPNNNIPIYSSKGSIRPTPDFAPSYWYGGGWYYFGRPGFVHGRWNGGSLGPCWTHTPIGLMWNCG